MLTSTGAVNVEVYRNGSLLSNTQDVGAGYWRKGQLFDKVKITDISGAANTVEMLIDTAEVGYDRTAGVVQISGNVIVEAHSTQGASENVVSIATVPTVLVVSNTSRRYLAFQNQGNYDVYFSLAGNQNPTVGGQMKIPAGGFWDSSPTWVTTLGIRAIANGGASNVYLVDVSN